MRRKAEPKGAKDEGRRPPAEPHRLLREICLPGLRLHAGSDRNRACSLFNAPQGACAACDGIGEKQLFDPQLVVPQRGRLTLKQGAVVPWAKSNPPSPYYMQVLASLAKAYGFNLTTPWADLEPDQKLIILHGTGGDAGCR